MTAQSEIQTKALAKTSQTESENNGWERLRPHLDPLVVAAPTDPMVWQRLDADLVQFLANNVSKSQWINHLALAAMVYAESGVLKPAPTTQVMNRFLQWAIPEHYADVAAINPEQALVTYFGDPPQSCGWSATKAYNSLQLHMQGFLSQLPPSKQQALAPFLFPVLIASPKLKYLNKVAVENSMTGRKAQTFAVVQHLPDLILLARQRYDWIAKLEAEVQRIKTLVLSREISFPAIIKVQDLDKQSELTFRVWDRASWVNAHHSDYGKSTHKMLKSKGNGLWRRPHLENRLFLELVGELPEQPWFLRSVALGVIQGPVEHTPDIQDYLRTWKLPAFGRKRHPGLLTPGAEMAGFLRYARRISSQKDNPPILFCVEPLLTASAVGLLAVVTVLSTGMRVGELLQVTLDRQCMTYGALPQFDDHTDKFVRGTEHISWMLYPKGRETRESYWVTPAMYEALFILIDLHRRFHGRGLQLIKSRPNREFSHARQFTGRHRFVFQWLGKQIHAGHINQCIAFLLLEHPCRDETGRPVRITSHILRHGMASWLNKEGIPLDEIRLVLKHVNDVVTQYYAKLSPEDLHAKLRPALSVLTKLTGADPDTVRSVGEIQQLAQEALKCYGALRHTPGGACAVYTPCAVQFKCSTCHSFVPDPTRIAEVREKITSHAKASQLFKDKGDFLEAQAQREHQLAWQGVEKEMEAFLSVELISPDADKVLKSIGADEMGEVLLQDLNKLDNLSLEGESSQSEALHA